MLAVQLYVERATGIVWKLGCVFTVQIRFSGTQTQFRNVNKRQVFKLLALKTCNVHLQPKSLHQTTPQ